MEEKHYILLYTANLIFILTNLYGWLLKRFYIPHLYKDSFKKLFPGQKIVATLYLIQIFELPYLFMINKKEALFYVNTFSVLFFSSFMVVMCEAYFLLIKRSIYSWIILFLPAGIITLYFLIASIWFPPMSISNKQISFGVVTAFAAWYLYQNIRIQQKIQMQIQQINERTYSNQNDFPVRFAQRIKWLPICICILMYICFITDHIWMKFGRDLFFTIVNVWFLLYTLNPHRQTIILKEQLNNQTDEKGETLKFRLSEERSKALEALIVYTLRKDELFRESHLSIDILSRKLHTNKNYISEALSRSSYSSFYNIVNQLRVEYAISLLHNHPEMKMETIAISSGFSSASVFSRIFKQYKHISPSLFLMQQEKS